MSANECSICYGKFSKTKCAKVVCGRCQYEACRECLGRYLLDPATTTPNCPNCQQEWTREFLTTAFTQKFINTDLKHHREEVLYQRERALLPLRQAEAEKRRRIAEKEEEAAKIQEQIHTLQVLYNHTIMEARELRYGQVTKEHERREFIQRCPNGDCRGFLSTQWKCGLCKQSACKECHEVKEEEHECDPDKVATAKMITAETRPCPKCGVRLFKISGCDQMWCTSCNDCAFNWVTGRIEKTIHNPHYFEYQRRINGGIIPRQPGDVLCGGEEYTNHQLNQVLRRYTGTGFHLDYESTNNVELCKTIRMASVKLNEVYRYALHIQHFMMPRYLTDVVRYNEEHGIAFLEGSITEEEFKTRLQRSDKKTQMHHDITNVLQMVQTTMMDIYNRVGHGLMDSEPGKISPYILSQTNDIAKFYAAAEPVLKILDEIDPLFEYANDCLARIAKTYGSKSIVVLKLEPA